MRFEYETDRLQLRVLSESHNAEVLHFYSEGAELFNQYEPEKVSNFYTLDYQAALLRGEYNAFLNGEYMRYFIYAKDNPGIIIGTVSFSNFRRGAYRSCVLGYKLLPAYQKHGYATEAIARLLTALFEDDHLHRVEAFTLADNTASIGLLLRLGFQMEGVAHSIIRLREGFVDHNQYALINPLD